MLGIARKRDSGTAPTARETVYRDLVKSLTSHIIELRSIFLAGEEDPRESLAPLRGLLTERDPKTLRTSVDEARRTLRDLLWTARQIRDSEKDQFRAIGALVSETVVELGGSDKRLSGSAMHQFEKLDDVVAGKVDTSPRVALAVAVRQLRKAFDEHARERKQQTRRMEALVTTLQAELQEAREQGSHDALTGLHNRGAFDSKLEEQLARKTLGFSTFGLILVDIDNFKKVNDNYGHPVGDAVLRHVADLIIKTCLRKDDFVARYGGEEFAIILEDVSEDALERTAERVRATLDATPCQSADRSIRLTASFGASVATGDDSADTLIERVDNALYEAKETGKNRVVVSRPS